MNKKYYVILYTFELTHVALQSLFARKARDMADKAGIHV